MKTNVIRVLITVAVVICIAAIVYYVTTQPNNLSPATQKYSTINKTKTYSENKDEAHELLAVTDKNEKYGLINKDGELVCDYKYDMISQATYGLYYVKTGKQHGFINGNLEEIVMTEETIATSISEDFVIYTENDKKGFINIRTGQKIDAVYQAVYDFSEGLAAVQLDDKVGFIDVNGKMVIPNIYYPNGLYTFTSGLCNVIVSETETETGKSYYIDHEGKMVISGDFQYGLPFHEDMAFVKVGSMWHVIDKTGNKRGDKEFGPYDKTVPTKFKNGYAVVMSNGKYGVINSKIEYVINPKYESLSIASDDMIVYKENGKCGVMTFDEKTVIPATYDSIGMFDNGVAAFMQDNKYGVIKRSGKIVLEPQYAKTEILSDGVIRVYRDEKQFFYTDLNGKTLWEPADK